MNLLREYLQEYLLGSIIRNKDSIQLVLLHNPNDKFPLRSITHSPKNPGMWQMQTFDNEENPYWDEQYEDLRDALLDQIKKGFKIKQVI